MEDARGGDVVREGGARRRGRRRGISAGWDLGGDAGSRVPTAAPRPRARAGAFAPGGGGGSRGETATHPEKSLVFAPTWTCISRPTTVSHSERVSSFAASRVVVVGAPETHRRPGATHREGARARGGRAGPDDARAGPGDTRSGASRASARTPARDHAARAHRRHIEVAERRRRRNGAEAVGARPRAGDSNSAAAAGEGRYFREN